MSNATLNNIIFIISLITSEGAPSGHVYARLAQRITLEDYNNALWLAKTAGYIEENNYYLTLTPDGLKIREKIEAIVVDAP